MNGAVRVVAAPTLFAHAGRGIVTGGGPVAGAAVVGTFVSGVELVVLDVVEEVEEDVVEDSGTSEVVVDVNSSISPISPLLGAGPSGRPSSKTRSIVVVVSINVVVVVVVVVLDAADTAVGSAEPTVDKASEARLEAPDGEVINAKVTAKAIPPLKTALLTGI